MVWVFVGNQSTDSHTILAEAAISRVLRLRLRLRLGHGFGPKVTMMMLMMVRWCCVRAGALSLSLTYLLST